MRTRSDWCRGCWVAAAGAAIIASGCEKDTSECAGVEQVGLVIGVTDAASGEPLCDARVRLVHAEYTDDLESVGPDPCKYLGGVVEGEYRIEVSAEGFAATTREVELLPAASCAGFEIQELEIQLTAE